MQKLTRRRFVGAAGATCAMPLVYVSKAFGAEYALKYANNSPITHPLTIYTTKAVERIKAESNGAIEIEVFPNNQLGGDTAMLSQLREGSIDLDRRVCCPGLDPGRHSCNRPIWTLAVSHRSPVRNS